MDIGFQCATVIDRDDLHVVEMFAFMQCAHDIAADAAKTIDAYFDHE